MVMLTRPFVGNTPIDSAPQYSLDGLDDGGIYQFRVNFLPVTVRSWIKGTFVCRNICNLIKIVILIPKASPESEICHKTTFFLVCVFYRPQSIKKCEGIGPIWTYFKDLK